MNINDNKEQKTLRTTILRVAEMIIFDSAVIMIVALTGYAFGANMRDTDKVAYIGIAVMAWVVHRNMKLYWERGESVVEHFEKEDRDNEEE